MIRDASCVERNLDRLKKTIFRLQKPNADHTTTSRDVQLVVPQERKNVLRRSKTSAGKKGPTTSLNNRTSSGIGNAAMVVPLVVVSSSAPVLGDLLKRFTNGDHHHRYHSQDDGDDDGGIQPHRGAEQSDAVPGRPQRRQRVDAAHMYVSAPPEGAGPGRDAENSTRENAQELPT
eukprot:gene27279-35845_t